jgi:energy-coupling factor transporter ATP-binding protein EcfA2
MTIVKLLGNSGSGKTTIARAIMALDKGTTAIGNPTRPEAYECRPKGVGRSIFVLGPYTNTCGGLDSVATWRHAADLLHKYAPLGHVLYEGLLTSTYYGGFGAETERYGNDHIFAFLDTPLEVCIARIKARRLAAGNAKPLNETNTRNREKPIDNVCRKVTALGRRVVFIKHDGDTTRQVLELFK